jgi:hypothetical protein
MAQYDGETSEDIGGFRYRVMMLDPLTAADILADLGYILAPVMGSLTGVFAKGKDDMLSKAMDGTFEDGEGSDLGESLERAIIGFFDRISKEKQRELFALMAKQTMVMLPDGNEPNLSTIFNTHFRGRVKSLYLWFGFAMKVQFKDFFTGAGGGISDVLAQMAAKVAPQA